MDICRRNFGAMALGAFAARAWPVVSKPKLTVLLIAGQLRADALEAAWPLVGAGGFRRLAEKGAWFTGCQQLSSTFPSCGLANLATGAWPAQHGIVADSWWDSAAHSAVRASDEALLATTFAAQATNAGLRVAVVAMTRAEAALFAGTREAHLYFLDERGQYTCSGPPPDWLEEHNRAKGSESARDANWMALNAAADAPPLRKLRYDANHPLEFLALYKGSPFGQTAEFEMAADLLMRERYGLGNTTDLLCVIDGSSAQLGYETGADSPLMHQMLLNLDLRIENLWNLLVRAVGENGFNLVVCAAHGAPPEPPKDARARMAVSGDSVAQMVKAALENTGRQLEKYLYPFLYLDRNATSGGAETVRRLAADAALAHPAVAGYYTAGGGCSENDVWRKRFQNSFHAKRSGDAMLSYRPEYVEEFGAGRGVSYGSLYNYDTHVPLFLYGPQFRAEVFDAPVEAVDLAPTLARALGLAEPSSSIGRTLSEALA
jgi:predicted AlkP superfamily pyrophosphatase or phosphodiesterase